MTSESELDKNSLHLAAIIKGKIAKFVSAKLW